MATWDDIQRSLDRLEELDKSTLESFSRVVPPAARNPNVIRRFDHAMERIRRRLDQIAAEETASSKQDGNQNRDDDHWYKKPVGIVILSVTASLLLLLIRFLIGI